MPLWQKKPKIRVLARHTSSLPYFTGRHLLFEVKNSAKKLVMELSRDREQRDPLLDTYLTLTLNGRPLTFIQASGCPTCQSMLAAGYGLPEDAPELRRAADAIAAPFTRLEEALERLEPVVGLLAPGYYILSLAHCFPTDGDGHFFWDVPNGFTPSPATAQIYDPGTYTTLPVSPCFLCPSQSSEKYDLCRVEEYRRQLREGRPLSPALCYSTFEYLSILLDGHHRACACALEGVPLPCLILSSARLLWQDGAVKVAWPDEERQPVPGLSIPKNKTRRPFPDNTFRPVPTPGALFTRRWELEYQQAALPFPTVTEAGALVAYGKRELTLEGILALEDPWDSLLPPVLLSYICRQPGADAKKLALSFTGKNAPPGLREAAFRILAGIKGDPEIEDLFVDYLVECEDKRDPLRIIADRYWD